MSSEFKKNGIISATINENGKQVNILKNSMTICPNLILDSQYVTGCSSSSGITASYDSDGALKVISVADNGNWCYVGFPRDSDASVGAGLAVGDNYSISLDVFVETANIMPTLFINSGNGYQRLKGDVSQTGCWQRIYYSSTWNSPGSGYGNIRLHLGFSGVVGTFYFKKFKLEKSAKPTWWIPNSTDDMYTKLGYSAISSNLENIIDCNEIIEN